MINKQKERGEKGKEEKSDRNFEGLVRYQIELCQICMSKCYSKHIYTIVMSNTFGTKDGKLYEIPGARTGESTSPRENFEFTPDLREISLVGPFLSLGGFRAHGIQYVSEVMRGMSGG